MKILQTPKSINWGAKNENTPHPKKMYRGTKENTPINYESKL
jgi:hypothetical protein